MSIDQLPAFRYFPDPISDGVVQQSARICSCCEMARGYIYTGPCHGGDEDYDDAFCPWCIASGDAADRFEVEFVDPPGVGGYGLWDPVPDEVRNEVVRRTPCFMGWQTERWFTHCGDAAAYLGRGGHAELMGRWASAVSYIRAEAQMDEAQWEDYSHSLARDGDCSAYVFQCLHCGALGGYSDCN